LLYQKFSQIKLHTSAVVSVVVVVLVVVVLEFSVYSSLSSPWTNPIMIWLNLQS